MEYAELWIIALHDKVYHKRLKKRHEANRSSSREAFLTWLMTLMFFQCAMS